MNKKLIKLTIFTLILLNFANQSILADACSECLDSCLVDCQDPEDPTCKENCNNNCINDCPKKEEKRERPKQIAAAQTYARYVSPGQRIGAARTPGQDIFTAPGPRPAR